MPNWCDNTLEIKGEDAEVAKLVEAVKSDDRLFDFEKIKPMPEILKNTGSGMNTIEGKKVNSWFQDQETGKQRLFTDEEQAELKKIGAANWYDWACNNWGNKWNARDAKVTVRKGTAKFMFTTAWGPPEPIIMLLRECYPTLKITCKWREEGGSKGTV